jgi:hypothetical protein
MPKYKFKYVYERWYDLEIEAESEEKAREMFENADFKGEPRLVGGQTQPDYEVEASV